MFKNNNVVPTVVVVGAASILTVVGAYFYQRRKKNQIPTEWTPVGKVVNLYLYPLKSGRAIELNEAQCTDVGVTQTYEESKTLQLSDRCLVVYKNDANEFRTARTYPRMVLIEISVHDEDHIAVNAPGMRELYVKLPINGEGEERNIRLWNESIPTIDCGDEAATWFSRYILDSPDGLRLGFNLNKSRRDLISTNPSLVKQFKNIDNSSGGLYTDLSSFMLMNKSSIDDLNTKLSENKVSERYFRPNILVDGENIKPYEEDNWEWIKIGHVVFRNIKPCTRCTLTTINPDNGVRDSKLEPLTTLKKYRLKPDIDEKSPVLGLNMSLKMGGVIHLNDEVYVGRN